MRTRSGTRVRVAALRAPAVDPATTRPVRQWMPLVRIGTAVTALLAWSGIVATPEVDAATARVRGAVVIAACVSAWVSPLVAIIVGLGGWQVPVLLERRRSAAAARHLAEETLVAVQLCGVAVYTGTTVPQTIEAVAPCLDGRLGAALRAACTAYHDGVLLDAALASVSDELGDPVVDLVTILRAAHADGDRVGPALGRLADRLADDQRRAVSADARRLSIRLLVPLACCSLPGFVLVAVVPFALGALRSLGR